MKIYRITTSEYNHEAKAKITSDVWFPTKKKALEFQRHFNNCYKKITKAELTFHDSSHSYYGRGRSFRDFGRDFKRDHGCHPASPAFLEAHEISNTRTGICEFLNGQAK